MIPRRKSKMAESTQSKNNLIRITDKTVQAEMKNKREKAQYQLNCKMLDKQSAHSAFLIDKEKKTSAKFMSDMHSTTGKSTEGLAPRGPWDREHEKSPYFHDTMAMSEKRRRQWRSKEVQIRKNIKPCIGFTPKWKQQTPSQTKDNIEIVMGMMGYNKADIEKTVNSVVKDEEISSFGKIGIAEKNKKVKKLTEMTLQSYSSVPDVFECLRSKDEVKQDFLKETSNNFQETESLFQHAKPNKFSIKTWEKLLIRDYTTKIANSPGDVHIDNRAKTAPNSSVEIMRATEERNHHRKNFSMGESTERDFHDPHMLTISGDIPDSGVSDKNYTPLDKNFEMLKLQRPHTTSGLFHNQTRHQVTRSTTALEPKRSLSPSQYKETNCSECNISNSVKNEATNDLEKEKSFNSQLEMHTENGRDIDNEPLICQESSILNTEHSKSFLKSTPLQLKDTNESENLFMFEHPSQNVSKTVSFNTKATLPIQQKKSKKVQILTVKRKAMSPNFSSGEQKTSGQNLDQGGLLVNHEFSDLPHWQRDLMREAPQILSTPKSPPKVTVVMSKSQRRRELQMLTDREKGNVKKICETEATRRKRSRANIFVTVIKVRQAVNKMKARVATCKNESIEIKKTSVL